MNRNLHIPVSIGARLPLAMASLCFLLAVRPEARADQSWLTGTTIISNASGVGTDNDVVDNATLMVTNGGSLTASQLNVGPTNSATLALLTNATLNLQTLLATNVAPGGAAKSTFNFNGGTLTTSNAANAVAAIILVASNSDFNINGNWSMNGGIHTVATAQTNGIFSGQVNIGSSANNLAVSVNANAVWNLGLGATNLQLAIGSGATTNNVLWVNNGSLIVTNAFAASALTVGNYFAGCSGNQLIITNGGQVYSSFAGGGGSPSATVGYNGFNNSAVVAGTNSAGLKATWNLGGNRLYIGAGISNNWIRVDQGGVITNVAGSGIFSWGLGNSLIITNGGQVFTAGDTVGRGATGNTLQVAGADGAGNPATLNVGGNNLNIGSFGTAAGSGGTNCWAWVGQGGLVTNVSAILVGGTTNALNNSLVITNGGRVFSTADGTIGGYTNANGNGVVLGGASALWNLGNHKLTLGNDPGSSNNSVTLLSGGVLTNVSSLVLGGANSLLNFNGGKLAAGANGNLIATNSTTRNATNLVQSGGAIIDAGTFTVTNPLPLIQDPRSTGGGLTKLGGGTLVLGNSNNYTGGSTISSGTLEVQKDGGLGTGNVIVGNGAALKLDSGVTNDYLGNAATLILSNTASVNLAFSGVADTIGNLSINGATKAAGTWGAAGSGAAHTDSHFTGTGLLNVLAVVPAQQSVTFALGTNLIVAYGTAPFADTATASSSPVYYASDNTGVATVDGGGNVTVVGAGQTHITAWSGDNAFLLTTNQQTLTVNKFAPVLALATSGSPAVYGDGVTLTANVRLAAATGTVQFFANGTLFDTEPLNGGMATSLPVNNLSLGTSQLTAVYSGDGNCMPATNSLMQVVAAAANGLSGQYFNDTGFTSLNTKRLDPGVNFDWSNAAPSGTTLTNAQPFAVRWTGQLMAAYSENYTFFVTANSGARLWVNEHLLMSGINPTTPGIEMLGTITLAAGINYNVRLEYLSTGGNSCVQLKWASPSTPKQVIPASSLLPFTDAHERGSILTEIWTGLSGANVATLTGNANYPDRPNFRDSHFYFECLATNWGTNYGEKVSGYIVPARSGSHTFSVAASDAAELWLSTDSSAANKVRLIALTNATAYRQFTNISAPVALVAWQKYYVELLHKAGAAGKDHYSVAWQPPGQSGYTVIGSDYLAPNYISQTNLALVTNYLANNLSQSHPRLLVSPPRFACLKNTLAAGSVPQLSSWWLTISNKAVALETTPVNAYPTNGSTAGILATSATVATYIFQLSLAYRLTGNTNFAERAWLELQQVASSNFPVWTAGGNADLGTAFMTRACAIGYDWLYDYWTAARRNTIADAIQSKGLNQTISIYQNYQTDPGGANGWATPSSANWNFVCNSGMVLGALALGPDAGANYPVNQFIISSALCSASPIYGRYASDNGAWSEGPGYFLFGTSCGSDMLSSLGTSLGTDFGLAASPGFSESASFITGVLGPLNDYYNYGDCRSDTLFGMAQPQTFWLARRFNRPEISAYERDNANFYLWYWTTQGIEALDLLWYDARGTDPVWNGTGATNVVVTNLPPDNYFRGPSGSPYNPSDIITLRTGWQNTNATFVGFKTGAIADTWHSHLDAGSFVLDALGYRWACDPGADNYLANYGSPIDIYYRERAEGHNTLVINPDANRDQNVGAMPPILLYASHPDGDDSYAVADLTSAYDIAKVWRGIKIFHNRSWFLVQDEIQASPAAPATNVWWFMHFTTNLNVVIQPNGQSVMMTQGSRRLWLTNLTGVGAFAISNAVPLATSPNPAGQSTNSNFQKLAINLANVTNTTLAILMVPLTTGQSAPTTNLPAVVPLSIWASQGASQAPVLNAVSNRTLLAGLTLTVTNRASDPNTPPQPLSFSLPTAPPEAVINPTNGLVSWRPAIAQAGTSNQFAVVVSQTGGAYLSATQNFWTTVTSPNQPVLSQPTNASGKFQISVSGDYGPDYAVEASTNLTVWTTLFTSNSPALPFIWSDPTTNGLSQRLYRIRLGP
ncbi:MAG: PA14 domain-containing protein [Verrucomicrobiota bacterium]